MLPDMLPVFSLRGLLIMTFIAIFFTGIIKAALYILFAISTTLLFNFFDAYSSHIPKVLWRLPRTVESIGTCLDLIASMLIDIMFIMLPWIAALILFNYWVIGGPDLFAWLVNTLRGDMEPEVGPGDGLFFMERDPLELSDDEDAPISSPQHGRCGERSAENNKGQVAS
ncbi:hypothetical protein F5Y04DRAFT_276722 [Hypomontagnella monticulosa]|nr:hypothetical protein F5Y04DRAFT_276722 [Hypomontagnella monticulosa]